MQRSFLQSYIEAFHRIEGWFSFDAALMFMAYNQLLAADGVSGDVLEIGVYYGLSAIAIAALRGSGRSMYAIDLFEKLEGNEAYGAGVGYRKVFEENMRTFHGDLGFLKTIAAASGNLRASDFPRSFSFCHVDGGHSPEETCADLEFAADIVMEGGLVALDDYFNPQQPGVCEGAIEFARRRPNALRPVAIGYNKVLFRKPPFGSDLNAEFARVFPHVERLAPHDMWRCPVFLFGSPFRYYFDLYASTPVKLVALGAAGTRATFTPRKDAVVAAAGSTISLPVAVTNVSSEVFLHGKGVLGLSYHLLSAGGQTMRHDSERAYLKGALEPGATAALDLSIAAPAAPGRYKIEIDLVWEGVMWFKDVANPTRVVELDVR